MQQKQYYKLYKSGKQWVTCALTSVVVLAGVAVVNSKTANQPKPAPSTVSDLRQ